MKHTGSLKMAIVGFVAAGTLALGANAQAVTLDAGIFAVGNGDAANPIVINVPDPGNPGGSGLFLDTINFDLGSFTHFNMTSTAPGIQFFAASIFQNFTDGEISEPVAGNPNFPVPGYTEAAGTYIALLLPDLGELRDYHLHPSGLAAAGAGYTLTMWGSNAAPVPVPAAVYLFGSGLIGLVGLARRKMSA